VDDDKKIHFLYALERIDRNNGDGTDNLTTQIPLPLPDTNTSTRGTELINSLFISLVQKGPLYATYILNYALQNCPNLKRLDNQLLGLLQIYSKCIQAWSLRK
jgi:hypothetical protein